MAELERRLRRRALRRLAGGDDRQVAERLADRHLSGRGTFNRAGRSNCGRSDRLQHGVQHAVGRPDQGPARHPQAAGRQDLLHRSEGRRPGERPRASALTTRRTPPASPARCSSTRPPARWATSRSWRSTGRRSSGSTSRSRSGSGSDRYNFELKGETFNLINTPNFFRGDMDINSTTVRPHHGRQRRLARRAVLGEVRVLERRLRAQGPGLKQDLRVVARRSCLSLEP